VFLLVYFPAVFKSGVQCARSKTTYHFYAPAVETKKTQFENRRHCFINSCSNSVN